MEFSQWQPFVLLIYTNKDIFEKRKYPVSAPAVGLCLCELVSDLVRKLQGTEAKASEPDIQKNNSAQGSQMASCPSDVNKKVMVTMCFSCFSVPILKET
jgi:hypothetical protein